MDKSQILEKLAAVVIDGTEDEAKALAQAVVANKIDPLEAIEQGLSKGMAIIGGRFECGEAYLPELLMAAASFNAAMAVLKPEIEAQKKQMDQVRQGPDRDGQGRRAFDRQGHCGLRAGYQRF